MLLALYVMVIINVYVFPVLPLNIGCIIREWFAVISVCVASLMGIFYILNNKDVVLIVDHNGLAYNRLMQYPFRWGDIDKIWTDIKTINIKGYKYKVHYLKFNLLKESKYILHNCKRNKLFLPGAEWLEKDSDVVIAFNLLTPKLNEVAKEITKYHEVENYHGCR